MSKQTHLDTSPHSTYARVRPGRRLSRDRTGAGGRQSPAPPCLDILLLGPRVCIPTLHCPHSMADADLKLQKATREFQKLQQGECDSLAVHRGTREDAADIGTPLSRLDGHGRGTAKARLPADRVRGRAQGGQSPHPCNYLGLSLISHSLRRASRKWPSSNPKTPSTS